MQKKYQMNTIALGNALVDVLLKMPSDDFLSHVQIEKGAMEMISEEQMIAIRKAQEGVERSQTPGGSACNTVRAMAFLGAKTGFIGKIGADSVGKYYEEAVAQDGVNTYFIKTEGVSGSCTVLISPDGEKTMGTFLGPGATMQPHEISDEVLKQYHCIYIEGYLIVNEPLIVNIMERAKRLGLKVALDLSNFNIVNNFLPLLKGVIPQHVDILFSNESEAEAYTGLEVREAIQSLIKEVEIAIVTLGKDGALIATKGEQVHVPAEGGKPIDTTGAGDHFAAGFLYGQSVGASLMQSGQIGSVLAGQVIAEIGPEIPRHHWKQIKLKVKEILG